MNSELDLQFSDAARNEIVRFRSLIQDDHFVALIQWGTPGTPNAHWGVGGYSPEQVDPFREQFAKAEVTISYQVAGLDVIIEPHFAKLLRGKLLDFIGGEFVVRERGNGT